MSSLRFLRNALLAGSLVFGLAPAAFAQGLFVVNSFDDEVDADPGDGDCMSTPSGVCTLRAAIMEANLFPGPDQILLPVAGTYTLTIANAEGGEDDAAEGDLDILEDLSIFGVSPSDTIVDGNALDRVFHVLNGQVLIQSMTIRGGVTAEGDLGGAGILLDVDDPVVEVLTVADVVVRNNATDGFAEGGGIANEAGTLFVVRSSLIENSAGCGGGLFNLGDLTTLENVTVSGNSAECTGGGLLDSGFGDTVVNHSTIAFNTPNNIAATEDTLRLSNTLLVPNFGEVNCDILPTGGNIDDGGNFVGAVDCGSLAATVDADLIQPLTVDPLSGHSVHRPLPGNPAINGGDPEACGALIDAVDQRGIDRPQGVECDSGAIEIVFPAFTSGAVPDATWNTVYSGHTFIAEGEPDLTFTMVDGALPTGLTLAANGVLTGTPTGFSPAPFTFTVRATDGFGQTADQATSITVAGAVISVTGDPPDASWNVPYIFAFSGTGNGALSFLITEGEVPAGLSLSSAGVLSGTPSGLGAASFTVTVSDASGQVENLTTSLDVIGTAISVTGVPPDASWNAPFNFAFSGSGNGALTYAITLGALPAGLSLSTAGVLSGTPTVVGSFNFTVTLTDATSQMASLASSLTVTGTALSITGTPPAGAFGTAYNFSFSGTGNGALAYAITAGALPGGLSLSSAGVLSGTPSAVGTFNFTVTLTDAATETLSLPRSILVTGTAISITGTPPGGVVGAAYAFSFTGTGNGTLTYTLDAGVLPPGITLSSSGVLSGVPTTAGTFPISVRITDATAQTMTHAVAPVIQAPPPPPPPPPEPPPPPPSPGPPSPPPAPNAPPVVTGLANLTIEENRPVPPIAITLADDYTGPDQLRVTVVPGDASILSGVSLTGTGSTRTLQLTLAEDREGEASVAIMVHDGELSSTTTARITVTPAPVPNPPTNLTGVLDGDAILFSWQGPVTGPVPTFFVLEGGNQSGLVTFPVVNTGRATSFRTVLPAGNFFFRARSGNSAGTSIPSAEISGTVGAAVTKPGAPHGLVASVEGALARLSWQMPADGGPADAWQIELGSARGLSDRAVVRVPASTLAVQGALAAGFYVARVRGVNSGGDGPASNEASFVVGGVAPCALGIGDPPVLLPAAVANRLVTLMWRPPTNSAVGGYRIVVGSAPGLGDLAAFDLGPVTSFAAVAPPGRYFVALLANNACGTSLPSNTIVVEVP